MKLITRKWLEILLRSVELKKKVLKFVHLSQSLLFSISFAKTYALKAKR